MSPGEYRIFSTLRMPFTTQINADYPPDQNEEGQGEVLEALDLNASQLPSG
jgi:hypothetical protein